MCLLWMEQLYRHTLPIDFVANELNEAGMNLMKLKCLDAGTTLFLSLVILYKPYLKLTWPSYM